MARKLSAKRRAAVEHLHDYIDNLRGRMLRGEDTSETDAWDLTMSQLVRGAALAEALAEARSDEEETNPVRGTFEEHRAREIARRLREDDCDCEFDYDFDDPEQVAAGVAYHYLRVCLSCGHEWWSTHCAHEAPRPCPKCGVIQTWEQAKEASR